MTRNAVREPRAHYQTAGTFATSSLCKETIPSVKPHQEGEYIRADAHSTPLSKRPLDGFAFHGAETTSESQNRSSREFDGDPPPRRNTTLINKTDNNEHQSSAAPSAGRPSPLVVSDDSITAAAATTITTTVTATTLPIHQQHLLNNDETSPTNACQTGGTAILQHTRRPPAHDSPRFTSESDPRLGQDEVATTQQLQTTENASNNDDTEVLFGTTMGLNNHPGDETLQQHSVAGEKMEPDDTPQSSGVTTTAATAGGNEPHPIHEGKDHEDDSTTAHSIDSSVPSPALSAREPPRIGLQALGTLSVETTPSTVSTAPSTTDEASLMLDASHLDRLSLRMEGAEALGLNRHRRVSSWELHSLQPPSSSTTTGAADHPTIHHFQPQQLASSNIASSAAATAAGNNVWSHPQAHARIASFRNEAGQPGARFGFPAPEAVWHTVQSPHRGGLFAPMPPPASVDPRALRHAPSSPYHGSANHALFPNQTGGVPPRGGGHSAANLPPTPPRGSRSQRPVPGHHHPTGGRPAHPNAMGSPSSNASSGPGNSRSSSEVLKTLLRKKACLYEPDTSRAVALVTWLVGRELALEFGFFSRQQLQAGVHACVADKIDSGVITRTKVNRCMQIILNSCFHYIIPRPDGSEENGDLFRLMFEREVTDERVLLRELPEPWNDLRVSNHAVLLAATTADKSPQASPALSSMGNPSRTSKDQDDQDMDSKKAVLLCFNENVRCAEDVFRCHNEFIRDTAHASHLQLSSHEWRHFFGSEAAGAPHLWGNIGIPIPANELCEPGQVDALGMLAVNEVTKFRTFWCSKRYEHDHELCGFAHIEVNGGWLRRNPAQHNYRAEMCQFVTKHTDGRVGSKVIMINECPRGINCEFAHSAEEMLYHPMRYKRRLCSSMQRSAGSCHLGDACPDFHPMDMYRFPSKKIDGRAGARHSRHTGTGKSTSTTPSGAPILYVTPAPPSGFEDHLVLPGLKNLYRRQSAVVRAHIRHGGQGLSCYSTFGDDAGVAANLQGASRIQPRGLPPVHHVHE